MFAKTETWQPDAEEAAEMDTKLHQEVSIILFTGPPVHCSTGESQLSWHCYSTNKNNRNRSSSSSKAEPSVCVPAIFLHPCMGSCLRK